MMIHDDAFARCSKVCVLDGISLLVLDTDVMVPESLWYFIDGVSGCQVCCVLIDIKEFVGGILAGCIGFGRDIDRLIRC